MASNPLFEFPDNLIVVLERNRRTIKVTTTEDANRFKVVSELGDKDAVIDGRYITERELKQLIVDSCINGFEIRQNLAFKKSLYGLAKELAEEREASLRTMEEGDTSNREGETAGAT